LSVIFATVFGLGEQFRKRRATPAVPVFSGGKSAACVKGEELRRRSAEAAKYSFSVQALWPA
jgi:hypothetical protein